MAKSERLRRNIRILHKAFLLGALVCSSPAIGEPIEAMLGGDGGERVDEEVPTNFWTWPDDYVRTGNWSPSSIWTPVQGVWYPVVAANGYVYGKQNYQKDCWFSESEYYQYGNDWYCPVQFIYLESGNYVFQIDCRMEQYSDKYPLFRLMNYKAEGSGYKFKNYQEKSKPFYSEDNGTYWTAAWKFSVPDDVEVVGFWLESSKMTDGRRGCEIWNVWLTREEDWK